MTGPETWPLNSDVRVVIASHSETLPGWRIKWKKLYRPLSLGVESLSR